LTKSANISIFTFKFNFLWEKDYEKNLVGVTAGCSNNGGVRTMNNFSKITLAVSFLLALAFTFSCTIDSGEQKCGGVVYDSDAYRCEAGELIGKCRGMDYYPAYQQCVNGVVVDGGTSSPIAGGSSSSGGGVVAGLDAALNGAWANSEEELNFNNGSFEILDITEGVKLKGTYTTSNGRVSLTITHVQYDASYGIGSNWYSRADLKALGVADADLNGVFTVIAGAYSISGNTLSLTSSDGTSRYTKVTSVTPNYSLDGVWGTEKGWEVTISGSTGVITAFGTPSAVNQDAINKGYLTLGGQEYRNLTSIGTLKWSGEFFGSYHDGKNLNVAKGAAWTNCTITMSTDGQTITIIAGGTVVNGETVTGTTFTYTRKR